MITKSRSCYANLVIAMYKSGYFTDLLIFLKLFIYNYFSKYYKIPLQKLLCKCYMCFTDYDTRVSKTILQGFF